MSITLEPPTPWHLVVAGLLIVGLAGLLLRLARRPSLARRRTIALVHAAVAALLVLAVFQPTVHVDEPAAGTHLAVALDVSASVLRAADDWPELRQALESWFEETVDALRADVAERGTASLVTFADGDRAVARQIDLEALPRTVSSLAEEDFPPPGASRLAGGLAAAAGLLEDAGGRGAVLLVSDGHETGGDVLDRARRLGRRGFPVHVLPLGGQAPEIGLYAADLPRRVEAGTPSWVRLMLVNGSRRPVPVELSFQAAGEATLRELTLPAHAGWTALRQSVRYDEPGIRFADFELFSRDEGRRQARRLFTYVAAPPRILAIGDGSRWARILPAERFAVEIVRPEGLPAGFDPESYDAVVVDGVLSTRFSEEHLERLAEAVRTTDTGVLLGNGPHRGDPEEETTLASYDGTPLEPLLPLINRPRPVESIPPPRQVVLLIDASGSMKGWPLEMARRIGAAVIARLRGIDRLHLIAFTGGAHPLLSDLEMSEQGKAEALDILGRIDAGGGTDPSAALAQLEDRKLSHCGLFVLSDGEFAPVAARPDCAATVFAIGKSPGRVPRALAEIAEPVPVPDDSFDPASIRISYFDPEPRKDRFEPGGFEPMAGIDALLAGWDVLPAGPPRLEGTAVTHTRERAELAIVRPRPRDPVLAYLDHEGGGTAGALTTELPPSYYGTPAVVTWVERLLAHPARERYAFAVEPRGRGLSLRVVLVAQAGRVPGVERLSAVLEAGGAGSVAVPLRRDPELPGVFEGYLRTPRVEAPTAGHLVLTEGGPGALRRPQRVPFVVPPPSGGGGDERTSEAWSFGLDEALLREVAAVTGGRYDPAPGEALLYGSPMPSGGWALRPWLLLGAVALYLVQIGVRRFS